jgi:Lipocalin-like domain
MTRVCSRTREGRWRLILSSAHGDSYLEEQKPPHGEVCHPLGKDAVGYIMYGQDGYTSVSIMRPDRPKFAAGDLLSGGAQERARATDTYVSYCGRYEFRGDTVVHRVELSLFPNWVGVEQERLVEVKGDRLTLSTRPILLGGVQRTAHLIWEAVGTSKQ